MEALGYVHHSSQFNVPASVECVRNRVEIQDLEVQMLSSAEQALGNKESN